MLHFFLYAAESSQIFLSSSEAHFYPLGIKRCSRFLLLFTLQTNVPALLRIQELPTIGAFFHKGTEKLGIIPGRDPYGRVVRIPWL